MYEVQLKQTPSAQINHALPTVCLKSSEISVMQLTRTKFKLPKVSDQ